MALVMDGLANLAVQALDRVGRVKDFSDLRGEREERDDLLPLTAPTGGDGRVLLAPGALLEVVQHRSGGWRTGRRIDRSQGLRDGLALLPRRKLHRVPDQVNDAGLNHGRREDGGNRFREALQPIDNGNQDIRRSTAADLRHHAHPELGALGLFDPKPEHFLGAGAGHTDREVHRLVADQALITVLTRRASK